MTEKLLPCPFCGGDAEQDYQRSFRHLSGGRLDHGAAIYCTSCNADMIMCRADHPELSDEERMAVMVENWNRRTPAPVSKESGWCSGRETPLSNAAQVFIGDLQRRAEANAEGEIRPKEASDVFDQAVITRECYLGMTGHIAGSAIDDLEALATQTVRYDAGTVPKLPMETDKPLPISDQAERGECRLTRGRVNDHISLCHTTQLLHSWLAALLPRPTPSHSPTGTAPSLWGAEYEADHAPHQHVAPDAAARLERILRLGRSMKWTPHGAPALDDEDTAVALGELFQIFFQYAVDRALATTVGKEG